MAKVFVARIERCSDEDNLAYREEPHLFTQGLSAAFLTEAMAKIYVAPTSRKLVNRDEFAWEFEIEEFDIADEPRPDLEVKLNKAMAFLQIAVIELGSFRAIVDQSEKNMRAIIDELQDKKPIPRT